MALIIFAAFTVILLAWFIFTYNRFIRLKNMMREAWSGIDVQLKRRHDLIPNLVESVKGYAAHEKSLFKEITELRGRCMTAGSVREKGPAETAFSEGIRRLFAVAEAYPALRANENFLELQKNLSELEDQIQLARRYYNGAARNLNILIESFPSMIVARMLSLVPADFFEIDRSLEGKTPEVRF